MAILTSNVAQFTFAVAGLEQDLRVARFEGSEGLSQLFRFHLELASDDSELDFASVVGKPALLTMYGVQGERYVNGLVSRFEQAGDVGRFTTYHAELVPYIWLLSYRHKSRIFQKMNVPDIISKVLEEAGIASDHYRWALQKSYEPREYCVQYRESELNFISRLLEEEGIGYFFEHTKERHVLVMGDNPAAHMPIVDPATVIYHEPIGAVPTEEYVFEFRYAEEVRPGAVTLRDYDFKKPTLKLQADSQSDKDIELEIYDYPGAYESPNGGVNLARVRLQAWQATRQKGQGRSVCRRFIPGYRVTLEGHPRPAFNQEYVLTRLHHRAAQPQVREEWTTGEGSTYANEFEGIPSGVPFRPPRMTHKPVVKGSQTAIVVGPAGEEIYTDEHGRVKVQFHWDREGKADENSSCWIRVSQVWAGTGWGSMFIPRIGQEVVVDFLEGDPDRPIIIGRVYHGTNRPPYPLPDEKTKSTIKSDSSKGSGGCNEIRFEDNTGQEQLFLLAQRNQDNRVKSDSLEWVGQDRHLIIKRDQLELVEGDKHLSVKGDRNEKVDGTISLQAGMDLQEKVGMNHALDAGMEIHLKAGMNVVIEAGMSITLKAGGGFIVIGPMGVTISGIPVLINSGGAAGAGSGSSPETPQLPLEADTAEPGQATTAREPETPEAPEPREFGPAATVLKRAAEDGTPFCEQCEKPVDQGGPSDMNEQLDDTLQQTNVVGTGPEDEEERDEV